MAATRRKRLTPAEIAAKQAERDAMLAPIYEAIREGRAYLNTAWGRRKVVGYDDANGWAFTNNAGTSADSRSFMVCATDIMTDAR